MRPSLALGCCVLALSFCFSAGAAHVHGAGEGHDGVGGLHLDHGHLNPLADHHHHGDHHHGDSPSQDHEHGVAQDHHGGVYLNPSAVPTTCSKVRSPVAVVTAGSVADGALGESIRIEVDPEASSDPPARYPTRMRAPPA